MCSVLRGLLLSPASATSVDSVQPQSTKTVHLRPQHYVTHDSIVNQSQRRSPNNDGMDYNIEEKLQQKFIGEPDGAISQSNSIGNTMLERNINDEEFYQNNKNPNTRDQNVITNTSRQERISKVGVASDKFVRVKREGDNEEIRCRNIKGMYYKYTIESVGGAWGQQTVQGGKKERDDEIYDSPTQLSQSPLLDISRIHSYQYSLEQKKAMNVRSDSLISLPQAFPPSGVPDFNQQDYISSSYGSAYGYPDDPFSPFDDSLLTPPGSLEFTKMGVMSDCQGDLTLIECGGVYDSCSGINMEPDWLNEPITLPTPEEQEGDINLFTHTPPLTPTSFTPFTEYPTSLTPEPSYPSTPLSGVPTPTSYRSDVEEIKDVLSLFDEQDSRDSQSYLPNEYLPFGAVLDSPSDTSPYSTPSLSPAPSCFSENSNSSFHDLLAVKEESSPGPSGCGQSRKRKTPLKSCDEESSVSKSKRSTGSKRRLNQTQKKERKRAQNKTAALRYRQRKKEEKSDCSTQLDKLEEKNTQLKQTVSSMTAEIEYLKKLWSEVSTAKQLKFQQELCMC